MSELLERETVALRIGGDERLARAELRRQIGRLEGQLAHLSAEAFPRIEIDARVPAAPGGPRLAGLDELERVRDALAGRIAEARIALRRQEELETRNRELLRRMIEAPAEHKWVRVSHADVGEPGCGHWHSLPRLGPIGLLMGWWRVKVSSGCPLAGRLAAVLTDRPGTEERPPAPWGNFPLAELTVLAGIVMLAIGVIGRHPTAIGVGVVLAGLGGLEVAVREHFAGYRSHTTLLAGAVFVIVVGALFYLAGLILAICLAIGALAFGASFIALRRAFQRASGGLSFRIGRFGG